MAPFVVPAVIVIALVAINALYVGAEFGAVSVRRNRVKQLAEQGHRTARRLSPILADPKRLDRHIAVCQVGITISSLGLGAYGQATFALLLVPTLAGWLADPTVAAPAAAIVVLVLLTAAQVIFGELLPKSLALQFPTQAALRTTDLVTWSGRAMGWFIDVLNGSGLLILRLFGAADASHRHVHSPEEIELLIAESRDGGLLEPDEHRRLRRALRLASRTARQLMVPRPRIAGIPDDTSLDEAIRLARATPYTRLPVYRGTIDNIVGILHTRDLIRARLTGTEGRVADVVRPVLTLHENLTGDQLLRLLRQRQGHQAVVLDEFGSVSGFVTLEDVLSALLGHVGDGFRVNEPRPELLPDGRVRLPGSLRLHEAERWLAGVWHGEADTISGHIVAALGRLPASGERVVIDDLAVEIERVNRLTIASAIVTPPRPEAGADD